MGDKTELHELDTEKVAPAVAESTVVVDDTENLPAEDDKVPAVVGDAEVDDGGVRTNSAVEPVADVLATGAGAPAPPPENVDRDGREVFDDGVPPTALATYDGPGAPPEQRGEVADADEDTEPAAEPNPVPDDVSDYEGGAEALAEAHTGDELAAAAEARGIAKSGSKPEVAERLIEHDSE